MGHIGNQLIHRRCGFSGIRPAKTDPERSCIKSTRIQVGSSSQQVFDMLAFFQQFLMAYVHVFLALFVY